MILYGHAESNAAWPALLADSPVQVRRGSVRIGRRELPAMTWPASSCVLVPTARRPRSASCRAPGCAGLRLTERLPYFVSGVAYPDCSVFRAHGPRDCGMPRSRPPVSSALIGASIPGEFAWSELTRRTVHGVRTIRRVLRESVQVCGVPLRA